MKIVLELDEHLNMKMELSPSLTFPVAFGMLKQALEDCTLRYRLVILKQQEKQEIGEKKTRESEGV